MGTADLRLGDSFKLLLLGAGVGAVGMFLLNNIKSVQFESKEAYAYPSEAWDLRDPGMLQPNFNQGDYPSNTIPREGMFSSPDPNFENLNFTALGGYEAPRNL